MGMLSALRGIVVYGSDGSVDVEATTAAVKLALVAEIERVSVRDAEIESVLDSVYTRLGVDIYPTPEVVSIAAATLVGSDLGKMAAVAEEVREYLSRSARFVGERGRKGGLRRLPK